MSGACGDRSSSPRSRNAADGSGVDAGTRDHQPKFASRVSPIAGSEPAEDGISGLRCPRVEDAASRDERLLRSVADGLAGKARRPPAGDFARIKGKLRPAGSAGVNVPELLGARKRQTGAPAP